LAERKQEEEKGNISPRGGEKERQEIALSLC
jgi:hypothetical protein